MQSFECVAKKQLKCDACQANTSLSKLEKHKNTEKVSKTQTKTFHTFTFSDLCKNSIRIKKRNKKNKNHILVKKPIKNQKQH